MNALEMFAGLDWWSVAGWTMLHYLWLGLVVGAVAGVLRFVLRRASANVRYVAALVCLVVLAVLPVGVGIGVGGQVSGVRESVGIDSEDASAKPRAAGAAVETGIAPEVANHVAPVSVDVSPIAAASSLEWNAVGEIAARWLPWVWIVGAPVTFLLLATGVVGAERLRRESDLVTDGPVVECLERLRASLSIGRRVAVAVCERVATPVLVGVLRPMILLPPAALTGWSPDEIEMVLLHELAHVRRWDNLVNLVQRLVEAALFFQPAVWLVSGWVRREREACCDAVVVGATRRPQAYAELLVALAAQLPRSVLFHPAAVSAMAAGPLRGRIRRILGIHDDPMLVSGKSLGVVMSSMLLAATLVVLNLPARSEAEQKTGFTTEGTEDTEGKAEVRFVVGASRFEEGDKIEISQVRGTKSAFEPGGTYWIEGTYTLASRDRASLSAFVTAKNAGDGKSSIDKEQTMTFERGSGRFSLKLRMPYEGWPHVSFYPAEGGQSFGGVYFGTGDSVLAKWWDQKTKNSADRVADSAESQTKLNLTKLMWGMFHYQESKGTLPAYASFDAEGKPLLSWRVHLLPFLGEEKLYREFRIDEPWDSPHNRRLLDYMPEVYRSPAHGQRSRTSYLAVVGPDSVFTGTKDELTTGMFSNTLKGTLAIVEVDDDDAVEWTRPADYSVDLRNPRGGLGGKWAGHWYGVEVGGSVRQVDANLPVDMLVQLLSPARTPGDVRPTRRRAGKATEGMEEKSEEKSPTAASRIGEIESKEQSDQFVEAESPKKTTADGTSAKSKFPTLEEQKLADLAYRRLGIELEKIGAEDLKRVEALGYDGGVKVTNDPHAMSRAGVFQEGDILVGLAVWPTRSLKEVAEVLNRDDLAELSPLKFYVVRPDGDPQRMKGPLPDKVVADRISVELEQPARSRRTAANRYSEAPAKARAATGSPSWPTLDPQPATGLPAPTMPNSVARREERPSAPAVAQATPEGSVSEEALQNRYGPPQPVLQSNLPSETAANWPQAAGAAPQSFPQGSTEQRGPTAALDRLMIEKLLHDPNMDMMRQELMSLEYQLSSQAASTKSDDTRETKRLRALIAAKRDKIDAYRKQVREHLTLANQQKAALRYDGKSFDQWRTEWQTELSTAKRIEAVKALAAFGRAGYGKEAAAVILDVAGEYDFTFLQQDNDANGKLKQAVVEVLSPESGRPSLAEFWLPDLLRRMKDDPGKWRPLSAYAVGQLRSDDPQVIGLLRTLAQEGPAEVRSEALGALVRSERISDRTGELSEETRKLLGAALASGDKDRMWSALWLLVYDPNNPWALGWNEMTDPRLVYLPEIVGPLLGADEEVRQRARLQLQYVQAKDAPALLEQLLKVLSDDSRAAEHVEAIRAIAAMGPAGVAATEELKKVVLEGKEDGAAIAAILAMASVNNSGVSTLLSQGGLNPDQVLFTISDPARSLLTADNKRIEELNDAHGLKLQLELEAQKIFPESRPRSGGGMF